MPRLRPAALLVSLVLLLPLVDHPRVLAATVPTGFADLRAVTVGAGAALDQPASMAFLRDGRLLVVEQKSAKIRLFVAGLLSANDPVTTLPGVRTSGDEQGLLGIAVDPGWPGRPYLYIHCDDNSGAWIRVSRYTAAGDLSFTSNGLLTVDPATRYDLLNRLPDSAGNHNGGTVRFGPDGMLYVSLGDDMNHCAAQDSSVLVGKVLRLDVSRLPAGAGGPPPLALLIPPGNPWGAAPDSSARLVWAQGFRNPFRFSLDPANGALFVGDVGEATWEEIDRAATGGRNFGWPLREGPALYGLSCPNLLVTGDAPIYTYDRTGSEAAIIGGCVFRGPSGSSGALPPAYVGDYFFSEYYTGFLRRLTGSGSSWSLAAPVAGQPSATDWGQGFDEVSDWAVGPDGALWYCRQGVNYLPGTGDIRRIVTTSDTGVPPPSGPTGVQFAPPRPSPAAGRVTLHYTLDTVARVSLAVFDATGRRTRLLEPAQQKTADRYDVTWDGNDDDGRAVRPGLYLARLEVAGRAYVQRLPFLR
jgi:glucose/arabinose dehydrogenase